VCLFRYVYTHNIYLHIEHIYTYKAGFPSNLA